MVGQTATAERKRAATAHIRHRIAAELAGHDPAAGGLAFARWNARTLADFKAALVTPARVTVNFAGGVERVCWTVTRSDGCYRVIWVPGLDHFSLAVESRFGPCDINVHGSALACFGSV